LLEIIDLSVLDDTINLEKIIFEIPVVSSINWLKEHYIAEVSDQEVTTYRGKKSKS